MGRGNRDAHNMYVSLVAETGLPGLVLFVGMLGSVLLRSLRVEQNIRLVAPLEAEQLRILRFGLIAYLIAAIFGSFHRVSFLYLYLAVLWSAAELFALRSATSDAASPQPANAPDRRRSLQRRYTTARAAR